MIWILSFLPLLSNPLQPLKTTNTIGTIVTLMFHNFFSSLARSKNFSIFYFLSFLVFLADLHSIVSILLLISSSSSFFLSRWGPFQVRQLQLVSPSSHVSQLFQILGKIQVIVSFFTFFHFHSIAHLNGEIYKMTSSFSLFI